MDSKQCVERDIEELEAKVIDKNASHISPNKWKVIQINTNQRATETLTHSKSRI